MENVVYIYDVGIHALSVSNGAHLQNTLQNILLRDEYRNKEYINYSYVV